MESRMLLSAVSWDGGGDGTSWIDADNWSDNEVPDADDDVLIDLPVVTVSISVSGAQGAHSVTVWVTNR
jgi:hypothetical protein